MPYSNPIVGGTALIRRAINSPNFVTTVSGWSINADGTAEFNNAVIRGSVIIGSPLAGPGAEIGPVLPAEIAAAYSFLTSITQFSILMSVGGGAYHYQIVGIDAVTRPIYAAGWVDAALVVHEFELQGVAPAGPGVADTHTFSGRLTTSQRAFWQFGTNLGASQTFRNTAIVYNTGFTFGAAAADTGEVDFNVPVVAHSGVTVDTDPLAVAATSDITYAAVSLPRGPVYFEQLTGTFTTTTALTEQQFFTTAASPTFPDGRAYRLRLTGQWECAAANAPLLAIREISSGGRALIKTGRMPIANLSTDLQFDLEGIFVNTSGGALTRLIVVTITLSAATVVRFDGAAAPQACFLEVVDIGAATAYPTAISLA